jgi:hypothetical protein
LEEVILKSQAGNTWQKIGKHGMELGWNKLEKSERVGVGARVDAMTERGPGGGMGSIGSVAMAM